MVDDSNTDPNQDPAPQADAVKEDTRMEIHKPKPVHNWRELLTEIGVVVIGVCIALAAEQAVEWVHWRNQVAEAREAIASEMAGNVIDAIARLKTEDCIEHRLDQLGQILDTASHSGSLPPVGLIGLPPLRQWNSGAWDSVVASQVASHFSRQELTHLASSYNFVQLADGFHRSEVDAWSGLSAMIGPGRRLDPASEAELRKALGLARTYNRSLEGLSYQILLSSKAQNLPYSQSELEAIAVMRDEPLTADKITTQNSTPNSLICGPIGAVPAQYGQSAEPSPPSRMADGMKLLPSAVTPAP
jgi:hypothetical protein